MIIQALTVAGMLFILWILFVLTTGVCIVVSENDNDNFAVILIIFLLLGGSLIYHFLSGGL